MSAFERYCMGRPPAGGSHGNPNPTARFHHVARRRRSCCGRRRNRMRRRNFITLLGSTAVVWVFVTGTAHGANRLSEPAYPHGRALSAGWNRRHRPHAHHYRQAFPDLASTDRWSAKSFVPVGATVWGPSALVVHPSLPVNTEVAELYAADAEKYAKVIRGGGPQALGVGARSTERQ
jgi:hypothetical protein